MRDVLLFLVPYIPFVFLLGLGFVTGSLAARRHEADLARREQALGTFRLSTLSKPSASKGELVTGSTVIAYDFFRRIAVGFRKIFGGRIRLHERFMMRARREAVLRMAEDARLRGASGVANIRLVSSNLGASNSAFGGCEVLAYGTAIWE